jgi:hypothetical protein
LLLSEGLDMRWLFLPPWSVRVLVWGVLALSALLMVRALREKKTVPVRRQVASLAARVLAIAVLLLIALNPTLMQAQRIEGKPRLAVLVDTSYSMSTRDVASKGRLEAALEVLKDPSVRSTLEREFELDIRSFDASRQAVDLASLSAEAARGRMSNVGGAVCQTVDEQASHKAQAGVLLVSDGRATDDAVEAARLALARSVPIWSWCLGGEVDRRDLWIEVPGSEVLAFAQDEVELSATLRQVGYEHRTFVVEVRHDDEVVQRLETAPGAAGTVAPTLYGLGRWKGRPGYETPGLQLNVRLCRPRWDPSTSPSSVTCRGRPVDDRPSSAGPR